MKECWELGELYPGAHIRVSMNNFYHHGIYIGNNEVVQFGLPNAINTEAKDVKVLRSPIEDFAKDGFIEIRRYSKKEQKLKRPDEEIVKVALSKVGEGGYNLIHNNCEHFANFCVFGVKASKQMDDIHKNVLKLFDKRK